MKLNKMKIYGLFAALALSATACSDSVDFNDINEENNFTTGEISLLLMPEDQSYGTRASLSHISDGSKVNVMFMGIYKKSGNDFVLQDKVYTYDITPSSWPYEVKLALDPDATYRVAFWAQKASKNSSTASYDTYPYDLTGGMSEIKVNYSSTSNGNEVFDKNNDENRDAFTGFCEIVNGKVTTTNLGTSTSNTVILHRPFAQLNIGTAGWDYESVSIQEPDEAVYTDSKVEIDGVAQYFDALQGKALVDATTHKTVKITLDYNTLPAFINVTGKISKATPYDEEEYLVVKRYASDVSKDDSEGVIGDDGFFPYRDWEYFLNYRDGYYPFGTKKKTDEDVKDNVKNKYKFKDSTGVEKEVISTELLLNGIYPYTEIYKYLSMSYILVPENTTVLSSEITGNTTETEVTGALLNSVSFYIKGYLIEDGAVTDKPSTIVEKVFTINNVPVRRNWRTNLLGNDFFMFNTAIIVDVVPDYMGDWTNEDKWYENLNDNFKDLNKDNSGN